LLRYYTNSNADANAIMLIKLIIFYYANIDAIIWCIVFGWRMSFCEDVLQKHGNI